MTISFVVQKLWSLIRSHLSILAFVANAFGVVVLAYSYVLMVLPKFSSRVFMVLGLMFGSLIHLELILTPVNASSVRCQEGVQFLLSAYS